jgi:hypothetical protein
MTCFIIEIPRWRLALLNELMHSVKSKIRLKKQDREMVYAYTWQAKIPRAAGKLRVSLHGMLGKGLLDTMKHAGLIVDDSSRYVELGPVTFSRDWERYSTRVTLEDL